MRFIEITAMVVWLLPSVFKKATGYARFVDFYYLFLTSSCLKKILFKKFNDWIFIILLDTTVMFNLMLFTKLFRPNYLFFYSVFLITCCLCTYFDLINTYFSYLFNYIKFRASVMHVLFECYNKTIELTELPPNNNFQPETL